MNEIKIISLNGYWQLHREENGKHYFGFNDHRIGLSISTENPEKITDWTSREPKIEKSYTDDKGKLVEYVDEPYTESQISSFGNLTIEQLDEWVKRGN